MDVLRFDAAMKAGDEASLQSAVALSIGRLLEGCYEAWVIPERVSREQACLTALERRSRRPLPSGLGAPSDDHRVALASPEPFTPESWLYLVDSMDCKENPYHPKLAPKLRLLDA